MLDNKYVFSYFCVNCLILDIFMGYRNFFKWGILGFEGLRSLLELSFW